MKSLKIFSKIWVVVTMTLTAIAFDSCSDSELPVLYPDGENHETIPVEITANLPGIPESRGFDEAKTNFTAGELIHITGDFLCRKDGETYHVKQYGVMKYVSKGNWTPFSDETTMSWPGECVTADFSAYYINGSNGILSENTMEAKLLTSYTYADDPLESHLKNVPYGKALGFDFDHLFAHLTLFDIQQGISDRFWLTRQENGRENLLNNAFHIEYDPVNKEITPVFSAIPDETYDLVFLSASTEYALRGDDFVAEVSFFVQPGIYDSFQVRYPRTSTQAATYLTYKNTTGNLIELEGNGRYEFSVLRSLGVITVEKPGTGWDETTDPFVIADVEKFLKAANSGVSYFEQDLETGQEVQILLGTDTGTELLRNVDFNNTYYDIFAAHDGEGTFIPNLSKTFDGGYHYIFNLGAPLFHDNTGIIKNLGIKGSKTDIPLESNENFSSNGVTTDFSRQGMIARINHGTVSNMRISDLNMVVQIKTSHPELPDQEAHNAALLFGTNLGSITDIDLSGNFEIIVANKPGETVIPTVSIGGVTGQNLGTISYIGPQEGYEPSVSIVNECNGSAGVYIVGGVVGNHTGVINDILLPGLSIDASTSNGQHSYIGGIVGRIAETAGAPAQVASTVVKGSLKAGSSVGQMGIASNSYTGGIAGYMNIQGMITNCSAACSVYGPSTYNNGGVYGTGGAFGRIVETQGVIHGKMEAVAAFGDALQGMGYTGCFSGIIPEGMQWSDFSNSLINVRKFDDINYVGASLAN